MENCTAKTDWFVLLGLSTLGTVYQSQRRAEKEEEYYTTKEYKAHGHLCEWTHLSRKLLLCPRSLLGLSLKKNEITPLGANKRMRMHFRTNNDAHVNTYILIGILLLS